ELQRWTFALLSSDRFIWNSAHLTRMTAFRYVSIGRQKLCRGRSEVRGELASVALDHALDALDVGIDVELRHADALQLSQLCADLLLISDYAEPVDDLVGHVRRMLGSLLGVMPVVVVTSSLNVVGQLLGKTPRVVLPENVGDVVADYRGEPSR